MIGDEVPVGGMADSIGLATGGCALEGDEIWPRIEESSSPPTAEGAIRLGIPSSVG